MRPSSHQREIVRNGWWVPTKPPPPPHLQLTLANESMSYKIYAQDTCCMGITPSVAKQITVWFPIALELFSGQTTHSQCTLGAQPP